MSLVSTATLATHLGLAAAPANAQSALDSAEALLSAYLGTDFGDLAEHAGEVAHVCPVRAGRCLFVHERGPGPVVTLTSVAGEGGTAIENEPLGAADFHVHPWWLELSDADQPAFAAGQRILVTYTTGWLNEAALPTPVLQAVLTVGSFISKGRDEGVTSERLGDYSYQLATDPTRRDATRSLPASARIMLQPWVRP